VEISIKESSKKEKQMEMEFLFKFNKEQFMMVPGQMTKNTDRELKNGSLEKYLMLVISKTVKKQEKEF
jgi:hypothetical protein